jgi:hypothetical protein
LALGCGGAEAPPSAPQKLVVTSAWRAGATIPTRYTCAGAGRRPPLRWSRPPAGTRELALVVTDPDAPGGRFVHWTAYGMPTTARAVPAGVTEGQPWRPPCPPQGDAPHRYVFDLYALGTPSGLKPGADADTVIGAMGGALAHGQLVGRFGRR